jgi:hypothetical protein
MCVELDVVLLPSSPNDTLNIFRTRASYNRLRRKRQMNGLNEVKIIIGGVSSYHFN